MSKIIQIRDVPDDVHRRLTEAAANEGLSLSRFTLRELEALAGRAERARANTAAIATTRRKVGRSVSRDAVLAALHAERGESSTHS